MPIGLLNPADITHASGTRPSATLGGVAQRRWYSDGLNTEIRDHDFNGIIAQIRHCIDHFGVPDTEGDDTLLRQAIQAGAASLTGNIAALQAIIPPSLAADKVIYFASSAPTMATFTATSFSRGLMANTNLATWQTALGITAASSANVIAFGGLIPATDTIAYFTSNAGAMAVTGFTPLARSLLDDTTAAAMRATLGVTGSYTDFSALTLTAAVPLVLNGATLATTSSPPTLTIATRTNTTGWVGISGANGFSSADGAYLIAYGGTNASYPGDLRLQAGAGGNITFNGVAMSPFATGTNAANLTGIAPASVIPGASITAINASNITSGTLSAARMAPVQTEINTIQQNTVDGADNAYTAYCGGGTAGVTRGAYLTVYGNEHPSAPGRAVLVSGNTGYVQIQSAGVNIIVDNVFTGVGTALTALNASNIASGTLAAARIADGSLPLAKLSDIATDRILGNASGANGPPQGLAPATAWAILGLAPGLCGSGFTLTSTDAAAAPAPNVIMRRDSASPAALDNLGAIYWQGNNAALTNVNYAQISCQIVTQGTGTHDGKLIFTVYNGANNFNVMTLAAGVIVGAPTGGDKGFGTINAQDVYDQGTLLTCVPLQREFLAHGRVNLDKWDGLTADGRPHEAARHFVKLLQEGVDPRNPLQFIAAMKEMQALPGMPTMDDWQHGNLSMGEIFSRLWLAVEMLAVAWMSQVEAERETRH